MPAVTNYAAVTTVQPSSASITASTATVNTPDQFAYGAVGMVLSIDQSAVAASSAGGGTGVVTYTVQDVDPISGNYVNSTAAFTGTTNVATFITNCYPGMGTVAPTSVAVGKADYAMSTRWRVQYSASSSATNYTISIAAVYLPIAPSSS